MAASTLAAPAARARALVLLYHGVGPAGARPEARFTLPPQAFYDQLWMLRRLQQRGAITVMPLHAWWRGAPCRNRPVVLCFDDGFGSDLEVALPALEQFGMPATFFLNTAQIGRPGYLTWSGVRTLQRARMGIESHGHEHRALTQLAPPALAQQLCTARHRLQEGAGTPVQFLAAPYGLWDQRVLEAARQAGFSALATSHPGLAAPGAACLARNGIRARTSARQLQRWLCRPASLVWPISRDYLLWTPKHILMHCPRLRDRITPLPVGQRSTSPY